MDIQLSQHHCWNDYFFHHYIALVSLSIDHRQTGLFLDSTAAAAKSLQSYLTLCDPRDGSPPGSPVPGILQARTLEWVAVSFSNAWTRSFIQLMYVSILFFFFLMLTHHGFIVFILFFKIIYLFLSQYQTVNYCSLVVILNESFNFILIFQDCFISTPCIFIGI